MLRTNRLTVREISVEDVKPLYEIYGGRGITEYIEPLYENIEDEISYTKDYIKNIYGFYGYGMWILEDCSGQIVGRAGVEFLEDLNLSPEYVAGCRVLDSDTAAWDKNADGFHVLGYVIDSKCQNKGYATEACQAIMEYIKNELNINVLFVKIHRNNLKSINLAKKLGFIFE